MSEVLNNYDTTRSRPGIILLVTLVMLVVLSTLGYTLSSRVAAQRHRDQYIIDYSKARYSCDSAVKYALATLEEIDTQLISRPNEPDFSDLFALDEIGYQQLLAQWGIKPQPAGFGSDKAFDEVVDVNDVNDIGTDESINSGFNDLDSQLIRGPYGPPWPFVTEPVEFEIGSTKVRIEIEDENAKYPLGWALLDEKTLKREADAGFVTFCEMMGLDAEQIDSLKEQLTEIGEIKPFKVEFKSITKTIRTPVPTTASSRKSSTSRTPLHTDNQNNYIRLPADFRADHAFCKAFSQLVN